MTEEILDLDQLKRNRLDHGKAILIAGIAVAALMFILGSMDHVGGVALPGEWIDYLIFGLMAISGPYGFYMTYQRMRVRDIERRLPEFLRDVAEAGRFGMTLSQAIVAASKGRYGRLTPEIRRMAAQIEWGVPASDAIRLFADRVDTPMVRRMTAIIIKANDVGGNVADVLTMVAHDAREVMLNQNERRITMATYTVVIYVAFAVFIATIFILNTTFLPKMVEAGSQLTEAAERAGASGSLVTIQTDVVSTVQTLLVLAVVIHAFGDGILAGVLQDGQISSGLRHSFIMLAIGFVGTRLI
ncbi:MAG: type II secretion system F family protein [Methanomassiliicoccaceae archaeon]|jgi:flagellar protein FlaJ|nr:type II secretion system F family protein [Euryarchaeota archaeon]HOB38097.1 type II secretion system F family protein [Methanomassiliicoccaceae archaeon]HOL08122.1 type II secretion system F family protein [Methanomassiliicoccaceae archaeon]HPP44514.1 type II secretion system F family protein [Methanomassiliicoccaceae archaeon]HQA21213.1 type II secretion system F family protein [Methanomassiliicoccaceae archaeon]